MMWRSRMINNWYKLILKGEVFSVQPEKKCRVEKIEINEVERKSSLLLCLYFYFPFDKYSLRSKIYNLARYK